MGRVDEEGVRGSSESEKGWMGRGGGIGKGGWGRGCVDLVKVRRGGWGRGCVDLVRVRRGGWGGVEGSGGVDGEGGALI